MSSYIIRRSSRKFAMVVARCVCVCVATALDSNTHKQCPSQHALIVMRGNYCNRIQDGTLRFVRQTQCIKRIDG